MANKRLLLFDIDGTLITSGGAGETALQLAFEDRFGLPEDLRGIEIAGRTDAAIARQILEKHGLPPSPENFARFLDGYLHHLALRIPQHPGRVLPGIVELLETLKARPGLVLALLTGNLERGARLKLNHYGVWDYFEFGAFADDHHDRNLLGPFAAERARRKYGGEFPPERVYVIGDTPHDIECGRAFGARTVAIATGKYSRAELEGHRPNFLFDDFSDLEGILAATGW